MKKFLSIFISFGLVFNPLILADNIRVDNSNSAYAPKVVNAPNGIQVVEIVKPNEQGLSHNKFIQYDVKEQGIILNNSNEVVNTRLGGFVTNNPNLGEGNGASVILNQITGTKKSQILGFTEVAGKSADVIISNPNGIYVNGAGFINVGAATLTTGDPFIKNGMVGGYDVSRGDIVIGNLGFSGSSLDKANLYSQTLTLNGKIYAKELNIALGHNYIDENANPHSNNISGSGVSLDSSSLGGIYANTIVLTSSDKGVGVNLPPIVLAQDRLILNAQGEIVLDEVNANNEIYVKVNSGDISANKNITSDKITFSTNKNLYVQENSSLKSKGEIDLRADNLFNLGEIYSFKAGSTKLTIEDKIDNKGLLAGGNLSIFANSVTNNNDSAIYARDNLYIKASNLHNLDYIRSDGDALLHIRDNLINAGKIFTFKNLQIGKNSDKTTLVENNDLIESYGNINIYAKELINKADAPTYSINKTSDYKRIDKAQATFDDIYTQIVEDVLVSSNEPSLILAKGNITLELDTLKNIYSLIASEDTINLNANLAQNIGKVAVTTTTVTTNIYGPKKKKKWYGKKKIRPELKRVFTNTDIKKVPSLNYGIQATNSIVGNVVDLKNITHQIADPKIQKEIEDKLAYSDSLDKDNVVLQNSASFFKDLKEDIEDEEDGSSFYDISKRFAYDENTKIDDLKSEIEKLRESNEELIDDKVETLSTLQETLANLKKDDKYKNHQNIPLIEKSISELLLYIDLAEKELLVFQTIHDELTETNKDSKIQDVLDTHSKFVKNINDIFIKISNDNFLKNIDSLSLIIADDAVVIKTDTGKLIAQYGDIKDKIITGDEGLYKIGEVTKVETTNKDTYENTLPQGRYGEFIVNTKEEHPYLIESNPLYATFSGFVGSSYLQNKLNFNQELTFKRLGDAMYETKLIRDSIIRQTGNRYLDGYYSDTDQFVALMDNALSVHEDLGLSYGVTLTNEQIQRLSKNIVWMEEKEIKGHNVLAPVLYLSNNNIENSGPKIKAGSINLNVKEELLNQGSILATRGGLVIDANSIKNEQGSIASYDNLALLAKKDISNSGGSIFSAKDMLIHSREGDITSHSLTNTDEYNYSNGYFKSTSFGKSGSFSSLGNMEFDAGKNIDLKNTKIHSNSNIILRASGDVNVGKQIKTDEYNFNLKGGYNKGESVTNLGSTIEAKNIFIDSDNINIDTSKLDADENILLKSNNDINILASNDVIVSDTSIKTSGFLSKKSTREFSHKEDTKSSELNAKNIVMSSGNDVTLEATKLSADENIEVYAGNDINLVAKVKKDAHTLLKKKSSLGGLKKSKDLIQSEAFTLGSTDLETKALNIILNSKNDINVIASNIESASNLQLQALNNILIAAGEEVYVDREVHQKTSMNPLNYAIGFTALAIPEIGLMTAPAMGDGLNIYKKSTTLDQAYDKKAKSSNIRANENIIIKSGETNVIGSNLDAQKNILISADTGVVNILAAKESSEEAHKSQQTNIKMGTIVGTTKKAVEGLANQETKIKVVVASGAYDKNVLGSGDTTHKSSNLNAENIAINSLTDLTITGSNLNAEDTIALESKVGDIAINEAINTHSSKEKDKHAKADISITVQNEYVEIGSAVKAALESAKQLKEVKKDYSNYKKELKKLENTLAELKQEYTNNKDQISYEEIEDLEEVIDSIKDTEKYYLAGIAAATADLATKTVAIATQVTSAATSSATWGFSAGIALDMSGSETKTHTQSTSSLGSNLNANNIYLKTNIEDSEDTILTNTIIGGSNLRANDNLGIATGNLLISSSADTNIIKKDTKDLSGSASMTMYGGGGGPNFNANYGESHSNDDYTYNTNSNLHSKDMNIHVKNDATIRGGTLRTDESLNMYVGNNLDLSSQRDSYSSNHKGFNVGGGFSLGADKDYTSDQRATQNKLNQKVRARVGSGLGSANANFGVNKSNYREKKVILSSITGDEVNIEVGKNTNLKGSLIAAGNYDEKGNFIDNGKLNLKTDTLSVSSLSSTLFSNSNSFGGGTNIGFAQGDSKQDKKEIPPSTSKDNNGSENKVNSSNLKLSSDGSYSSTRTLATIGSGNLVVNQDSDDLQRLNRDTDKLNKEIYAAKIGTSVDASLDHRLLSKDGWNQIDDDIQTSKLMFEVIGKTISKDSLGLFDNKKKGVSGYRDSMQIALSYKDAAKDFFINNPDEAKILASSNMDSDEYQRAYQALEEKVAYQLNIPSSEIKLVVSEVLHNLIDPQSVQEDRKSDLSNNIKGHTTQDGRIYVVQDAHNDMKDMTSTAYNEFTDKSDIYLHADVDRQNAQYKKNRGEFSDIMGKIGADLLDYQYTSSGYDSLGNVQNNNIITHTALANTKEFRQVDKSLGADRRLNNQDRQTLYTLTKGKSPEEVYKLAAAACALVRCADGVPLYNEDRDYLLELQIRGESYVEEQNLLLEQSNFDYTKNKIKVGNELKRLADNNELNDEITISLNDFGKKAFQYSILDKANDAASRNEKITGRVVGGVETIGGSVTFVAGGTMAIGGISTCVPTLGIGCAFAATGGTALTALGGVEIDSGLEKIIKDYNTYSSKEGEEVRKSFGLDYRDQDSSLLGNATLDIVTTLTFLKGVTAAKKRIKRIESQNDALKGITKIFENGQSGVKKATINIEGKVYNADQTVSKGAAVFKGVSEVDMINYFKKLSGVDKLPPPKAMEIDGKIGIRYTHKDKNSGITYNLRNVSKSSEQTGAKWTIDIVGVEGKEIGDKIIRKDKLELKFQ